MEIWKDIVGYNGLYQISNCGRVKSFHNNSERIIKPKTNNKGYKWVVLNLNKNTENCLIHRLVAKHFIENPNNHKIINHIDENPSNNKAANLEWMTHAKNVVYGSFTPRRIRTLHKTGRIRNIVQKDINGKILAIYSSIKEASIKSGVPYMTIHNILKHGVRWRKDFLWEYIE